MTASVAAPILLFGMPRSGRASIGQIGCEPDMKLTRPLRNAQTERFRGDSTARDVDRYYSVVKEPLKAAFRWERDLSSADIDCIQAIVGREARRPLRVD